MSEKITQTKMMQVLDWAYDKSVQGIPGFDSAEELAKNYMKSDDLVACSNSLIRWQNAKTGTTGFISGLGGVITMPVAIPASIASLLYVQIRMVAAIAHMGGYDLRDDRVRSFVYVCLTGSAAKDIMKEAGINFGTRLTISMIKKIPGTVATKINQKVGFRLVTKFGSKGVINLGKMVPLVGGVIGGTFDSVSTNIVGNVARRTFIEQFSIENMVEDQKNSSTLSEEVVVEKVDYVAGQEKTGGSGDESEPLDEMDEKLVLNGFSPKLQKLWVKSVGPVSEYALNDEGVFRNLAKVVYVGLPVSMKSLVRETVFIDWCYEKRRIFTNENVMDDVSEGE